MARKVALLIAALTVSACTTAAQRRAAENAAIQKEVARETKRICTLPEAEREAELEKIKKESGIVIVCGQ